MTLDAGPFVTLGWSAISWIEHYLVHGPGDVQGQPVELDDEFARFILKAYRLNPESGARRVRRAFLSRAKGRSKSGLAGFVACFEALGPARFDHWAEPGEVSEWGYEYETGEPVGRPLIYVEALCVATEEGQAGNTYDGIHYMLNPETCSDELREDYPGLDVGLSRVILPDSRGSIEPLSSGDSSKDGGKSTFIVADETHLWKLPRLKSMHATMVRNLLKRKVASGWMLETSTMYGQGEDSVAEGTHAYAKSAKPGTRAADSLLFDHQQASDEWNPYDRRERVEALLEAYGPAAEWMDIEALADAWDDPQVTESEYRRYWLNQPVPMKDVGDPGVIPTESWADAKDHESRPVDRLSLGVEVGPDLQWASVSIAGQRADGSWHIALEADQHTQGKGVAWLVPYVAGLVEMNPSVRTVVVDVAGPVKALLEQRSGTRGPWFFAGTKVRAQPIRVSELGGACANLLSGVVTGDVRHIDQPQMNAAALSAGKRALGDTGMWVWSRRTATSDITPIQSATLALHGAQTSKATRPGRVGSGRRVVTG